MRKELFLIRHAEAEQQEIGSKDFDRILTPEGEIVASKCGNFLSNLVASPDALICSSSMRTRQTAGRIVEQIQFDSSAIEMSDEIYEASTRILMRVVNELSEEKNKVILVGHNPAISYLAEYITGAEIGGVPPAGIVHMSVDISWAEISDKSVDLVQFYPPHLFLVE